MAAKERITFLRRVLRFAVCFTVIAILTSPALVLFDEVDREPMWTIGLTIGLTAVPAALFTLLFSQPAKPDSGWLLWLIGLHVFFFGSFLTIAWLVKVTGHAIAARPGWIAGLTVLSVIATIVTFRRSRRFELRASLLFAASVLTGTWLCIGYVMLKWMSDNSWLPITVIAVLAFLGGGLMVWKSGLRRRYAVLVVGLLVPTIVFSVNKWHSTVGIPSATVLILKQLGPPAIPSLIRMLEHRDREDAAAVESAVVALGEFGPAAKMAAPAIVKIARKPRDEEKMASIEIVRALSRIDADQKHLIALLAENKNAQTSNWERHFISGIAELQVEGKPFVPVLEKLVLEPRPDSKKGQPGWDLKQQCVRALGEIGPSAIPALVRILDHWDAGHQKVAAEVLGEIGPSAKAAIPGLLQLLTHHAPSLRRAAESAILSIGFAESNPPTDQQKKAIDEFVHGLTPASLQKLLPVLTELDPNANKHLAAGMKRVLRSKRNWFSWEQYHAFSVVMLTMLAPDDENTSRAIVDVIHTFRWGRSTNLQSIITVLRKIATDNATAREALKYTAKDLYENLQKIDLLKPKGYDYADIRLLGSIGPLAKIAFPLLVDWGGRVFSPEIDPKLVEAALQSAEAMDAPDYVLLKAAMRDTQSKSWEKALVVASKRGLPHKRKVLVPELIELLQNNNLKKREAVIRAGLHPLCIYTRPGSLNLTDEQLRIALPILIAALDDAQATSRKPIVNRFAKSVLRAIGKPAVPALIDALNQKSKNSATVQLGVVQILGGLGNDAEIALPTLKRLASSPNADLKKAAMKALGTIKPTTTPKP